MKRRLLASILSFVMVMSLLPVTALARGEDDVTLYNTSEEEPQNGLTGYCGDPAVNDGKNVTWKLEQNDDSSGNPTYTLTISGKGAMADYYQVGLTSPDGRVPAPWMENYRELITKVIIENGVTKVGSFAFAKCTNLVDVVYPENCVLTRSCLKACAFTSITVSAGNISTDEDVDCTYVFSGNTSLTSITFNDGITFIPDYYVAEADSLTRVTIPASVTTVGTGVFRDIGELSEDSSEEAKEVSVVDESNAIDWLNRFDDIFGTDAQNIVSILAPIQTVSVSVPTGAQFSLFSKIAGYDYVSSNPSVMSVDSDTQTATAVGNGTATVTGTKDGSMTVQYNVTVTDEARTISNWNDLLTAFQYGGKYQLGTDLTYSLDTNTEFVDGLLIADGVSVELDLNGKTISVSNVQRVFGTNHGGKIALSNGTITATAEPGITLAIMRSTEDQFSAESVSFTTSDRYLVYADNGGKVSLKDCDILGVTNAVVKDNKNSANYYYR